MTFIVFRVFTKHDAYDRPYKSLEPVAYGTSPEKAWAAVPAADGIDPDFIETFPVYELWQKDRGQWCRVIEEPSEEPYDDIPY